jgi:hypothetical protein
MPGGTHPPLSVIMTWSPNYIDPETRGWGLIVLCIVLMVLVYIVVALRVYARFIMSRNAGIDDVLTVINLVGPPSASCLADFADSIDWTRHFNSPLLVPRSLDGRL